MPIHALRFFFFLSLLCSASLVWAQDSDKPEGDLATPYDALQVHLYYLRPESYDVRQAAKVIPVGKRKEAEEAAVKIKQIYDGRGLWMRWGSIPEEENYTDSLSNRKVFTPFPVEFPQIYLERNRNGRWQYSRETVKAVDELHKKIYPFGSDFIINIAPKVGQYSFLGIAVWQYVTMLIMALLGMLAFALSWRLFKFLIELSARTRLGSLHLDPEVTGRIAKLSSYVLVTYLIYIFLPVLQFSAEFSFYVLSIFRITNTVFFTFIILGVAELLRGYLAHLAEATEHKSDDQLVHLGIRTLKAFIVIGGILHVLSVLNVNITALIAGLSIGGLAVALAAQETVKNLFGSVMLYADRPFHIGDFIAVDGISGTVLDIGFRSTRIRAMDTSIITIPNANMVNVTLTNLGARDSRRINLTIGVTYHTPPDLINLFVQGLRELANTHPMVHSEPKYIHFNDMADSSLNVLFVVYLKTQAYDVELKYREEILFEIMRLAETLGVQIAYPSRSLYIETMPGQKGLLPDYKGEKPTLDARYKSFQERLQQLYPKVGEEDEDLSNRPLQELDAKFKEQNKEDSENDEVNKSKSPSHEDMDEEGDAK